jgi:4-carboxymuconolactone decarboxylase
MKFHLRWGGSKMDQKERFQLGMDVLNKLVSKQAIENVNEMEKISPVFYDLIVGFGYGELWGQNNTGISLANRSMITISSLITQGSFEQLEFHLRVALKAGLSKEEIIGTIIHLSGYTGFPKAVKAMQMAHQLFQSLEESKE